MRSSSLLVVALFLLPWPSLASPEALQAATAALETGRAEEAFFALEDAPPKGPKEKKAYGDVLVKAAELLLGVDDAVFALQLGKKALSHQPGRLDARLLCLQAALQVSSLDEANSHLVALEAARPADPNIVLWRARLSAADAEWAAAKAAAKRVLRMKGATAEQKAEAKTLARRAEVATEGEQKKLAALSQAERENQKKQVAMERAREKAMKQGVQSRSSSHRGARDELPEARSGWEGVGPHVVLYCDSSRRCARARSRLKHHGVSFSEEHVGRSNMAATELAGYGYTEYSVPVYVMHGKATTSLSSCLATLRAHGVTVR